MTLSYGISNKKKKSFLFLNICVKKDFGSEEIIYFKNTPVKG